jgi:hypothetical protein
MISKRIGGLVLLLWLGLGALWGQTRPTTDLERTQLKHCFAPSSVVDYRIDSLAEGGMGLTLTVVNVTKYNMVHYDFEWIASVDGETLLNGRIYSDKTLAPDAERAHYNAVTDALLQPNVAQLLAAHADGTT